MDLFSLLAFYCIFTITLIIILRKFSLALIPSITLGLIAGQIILNLLYPPQDINSTEALTSSRMFYYGIQYLTPIYCFIVLIVYCIKDFEKPKCIPTNGYTMP